MSRVILLDPSHWAGKWSAPDEDQHYDLKVVNQLGYDYGTSVDSAEKEAKLLQLLEYFHGYLMKYVLMIQWGTIPPDHSRAGRDAKQLLRTLAPRGSKPSKEQTSASCKMLHLAFKGQSTEEIYDTLAFCFMKAARRYDPYYHEKTKRVCEEVHGLPKEFSQAQLGERVDFDCTGILRAFVRKEFLASIADKKKVVGYTIGPKWPPPASYFQSGPVGFVYMLQMWFRYYVNEYIIGQMQQVESDDGFLQLSADDVTSGAGINADQITSSDRLQAHAEGNCVNTNGTFRFMADRTLMDMSLDISSMDLEWVAGTSDKLFKGLSVQQRMILYLVFFQEQNFKVLAKSLSCDPVTAKKRFDEVLDEVRRVGKIAIPDSEV